MASADNFDSKMKDCLEQIAILIATQEGKRGDSLTADQLSEGELEYYVAMKPFLSS